MKFTISDFNKKYQSEDDCLDAIFTTKYGKQALCSQCNRQSIFHKVTNRKCYACQWCGHHIHPLANTIFHKSSTSLKNWFFAIFLFSNSKNGVSAKEIERQLGVTYKCAWRMCNKIRLLLSGDNDVLAGIVEVDETYIGGKEKNKHKDKKTKDNQGRSTKTKNAVIGAIEKKGKVVARVVDNTKTTKINEFLVKHIKKTSELHTDEYQSYNKIKELGYNHKRVNHGVGKYVIDDATTNSVEGFWSQLKRSINGTYHAVSLKYLQHYVNEFAFRYNMRHANRHMFDCMIERV